MFLVFLIFVYFSAGGEEAAGRWQLSNQSYFTNRLLVILERFTHTQKYVAYSNNYGEIGDTRYCYAIGKTGTNPPAVNITLPLLILALVVDVASSYILEQFSFCSYKILPWESTSRLV